jgi:hypothetical protein
LDNISKGKNWKWTEVRPDAIIGFVPNNNAMNLASSIAVYMSLYRHIYGEGAEIPFPGTEKAWNAKHTDSSSYILSRFEIYAALHGDKTSSRTFNIADGNVTTWSHKWCGIAEYFGLTPGRPTETTLRPEEFYKKHAGAWQEMVKKHGLAKREETGWWFMEGIMSIPFDRHYDLRAAREVGFDETIDTVDGYIRVFEKMREAKFIP